jgi:hypothetical protein
MGTGSAGPLDSASASSERVRYAAPLRCAVTGSRGTHDQRSLALRATAHSFVSPVLGTSVLGLDAVHFYTHRSRADPPQGRFW